MDMNLNKLREMVEDRGAQHDTIHKLWQSKELDMAEVTAHMHEHMPSQALLLILPKYSLTHNSHIVLIFFFFFQST